MSALQNLKLLDVRGTLIEDAASSAIASLKSLEVLNTRCGLYVRQRRVTALHAHNLSIVSVWLSHACYAF